ncbi:MAG TPA: hypothetical protein PKE15_00280 [Ottowia sp.]|nr:hypothetical protein [Ottowia sp.]
MTAANAALLALLDASGTATVKLRSSADVLLSTITLTSPAGTINGGTGVLTITPAAVSTGVAIGAVAYAEICTGSGTVHLALPAVEGSSPVSGKVVINDANIVVGSSVALVSATIG